MRTVWLVSAIAACGVACGGSEREAALERRIAELEATRSPAPPLVDPRVQSLQQRVDQLESLLRELRQLEIQTQQSVAQLAERPPTTLPPPHKPGLDHLLVYDIPTDDSPTFGDKAAAVTIVAAVQFPEPYTHKAWSVVQDLRKQYGRDLRVVLKHFVVHPQATDSSIAACAVAYQGQIDLYDDALWSAANPAGGQRRWPDANEARDLARDLRIDVAKFDRDVSGRCALAEPRDQQMFKQRGQAAVPVFWINGHPLEGARGISDFQAAIDVELAKALADRKAGGKAATYYERVTKTGATAPAP